MWHVNFESSARLETEIELKTTGFKLSGLKARAYIFIVLRYARTLCRDEFVAPLVDHADTNLTLVALLAEAPDEVSTVRTEGWLA